uniref:PLA2c domain-containing protein n=1 Tax=Cyprinus carpio TaxID=7962 RepID=A0A8C2KAE5_CYPCA
MSASKLQESCEVRIKHSLNKEEEEFIVTRRKSVFPTLGNLETHCNQNKMPNIALLGSGGGQRAMVGLLGSLVQLDKAGLLDCNLYLSGVSGSTWCMASLYQEPDWSTKLETVKDKIIKRLSGPGKYYYEKDIFSLTDVWAVLIVTEYVKEIDEQKLSKQWDQDSKDPFPIYTVIDKQCKQCKDGKDVWFEISPLEAGYSLTGAFVETSSFGSQFDNGSKKKQQPEMDMLYLQALCGSALADEEEIRKFIWQKIKVCSCLFVVFSSKDPNDPLVEKCSQVLMDLVDKNLSVLNGIDPSAYDKSIRKTLKGKLFLCKLHSEECVCITDVCISICRCIAQWIWGRKYNFLHNMTDETVPRALLESETRDYEDAALLLNSPYFSVLRDERDIDLIISLDFSEGDPFMTLTQTAEMCKKQKIHFPDVPVFPEEEKKNPKDFYVFTGQNAPTVIHMPLFNVVNCGDDIEAWRKKYRTFQDPYSAEMITDLMEAAGKNISNNRERLKKEICPKIPLVTDTA